MIGIKCKADIYIGEGELKISDKFNELNPLLKADLLKDWSYEMNKLYNNAVNDWHQWMKDNPPVQT